MRQLALKQLGYPLVLLLSLSIVFASEHPVFEVKSGSTQKDGAVYFLNAVFEIDLPPYIVDSFEQGFDIPLVMEVEVYRDRSFWLDDQVVYLKQQYRLQYHPVMNSISLLNVNQGNHRYFGSLPEAVRHLSALLGYPLLDGNNLLADETYHARLRFGIDANEIPIPLKSSSLWKNDWELESDWMEWDILP